MLRELPLLLTHSGLIGLDGFDLSLEANEHLFQWPGELVYGKLDAFAGSEPETIPPEDWRYRRLENPEGTNRASQRFQPPSSAPNVSIRDLRGQLTSHRDDKPHYDIARPTQARAFEQRLLRQDVYNPFLDEYPMKSLSLEVSEESETFEPEHHEGAQWVLDWFSEQFLGAVVLSPDLVFVLGAYTAGGVLSQYLLANADSLDVATTSHQFKERVLADIQAIVMRKLVRIEAEIHLWASYGRSPVEKPDGSPDLMLSAVDAMTAAVGIHNLANLACYLQSWLRGSQAAYQGITDSL